MGGTEGTNAGLDEARPVLAAFVDGCPVPSYVMLLDVADGKVQSSRDFR